MRRLATLVLATVAAVPAGALLPTAPASAHVCPSPVEVAIGQPVTVAVGVTVENATVTDVELTFPPALRIGRVDAKEGWRATRTGSTILYRGGPIVPYSCAFFSVLVTATERGAFGIGVILRTADGTVVARVTPDVGRASDRLLDQFVYAGVKPPGGGGGGGPSIALLAGIGLVAAGVALGVVLAVRGRRQMAAENARTALDPELRARLDEFRKRAPRRRRRG